MIKVIRINEDTIRVVKGKLLNELDMSWEEHSLDELKSMLNFIIPHSLPDSKITRKLKKVKNFKIHQGSNHLDLINHNIGSLELLTVEDHFLKTT